MFPRSLKSAFSLTFSVLCLLVAGCLHGNPIPVQGVLHGELVWQGDVYIRGDVVVESDATVILRPGTRVRFLPPGDSIGNQLEHPYFPASELIVKGRIYAVGTKDQPIVFESASPDDLPGSWGAINMEGSEEAVFEFCLFRQADSAVHSRDSNVYIQQSVFQDNLVGIRFHDSNILIENNLIRRNGAGVRFHFGSPVICENIFLDNEVNVFVTSYPSDYRIENNTFGAAKDYQVVLGEQVPDDLQMSGNYWLTDDKAILPMSFYDRSRTDYLGSVIFEPTLTSPSRQAGPSWNP